MSEKISSTTKKDCLLIGSGILIGLVLKKALNRFFKRKKATYDEMKSELETIQPNQVSESKINIESENYRDTVKEQLARNGQYFGEPGLNRIKESRIIIVGVGGVGSHVAAQLIRAGVSHIKVIDFDLVTLSSLNRHAFAVRKDVGISKVQCIANYAKQILPHLNIEIENKMFSEKNAETLISFGNDEQGNPIKIGNYLICLIIRLCH
jgi:tRNA A37 threonylcarbamoyladenosine dehydratase